MITGSVTSDPTKTEAGSAVSDAKKSSLVKAISAEFDKLLKASLSPDSKNEVSEEELFAAIAKERIEALKGTEVAKKFADLLKTEKSSLAAADGFAPAEQATINALKKLVDSKELTADEGSQIYSEAFTAAQLDGNNSALFDSRGGPGDPTMAMATLEVALKQARSVVEKLASGEATLELKSLANAAANGKTGAFAAATLASDTGATTGGDFSPNGTVVDGPEGFLFKPVTNNEGKLAVLLGQNITGNVSSVVIKDSLNSVIENGILKSEGIKETGREKWTFSKTGSSYPKDITVEVTLSSGEVQRYKIPDPSKRYD